MSRHGPTDVHASLIAALRDPAAYPHAVERVELIETHISSVLLAGDYAYKLKKPVDLGFANFSTLERRKRFCDEEIRLNRRSAPALYLDVVPITGALPAPVRVGGEGAVLDYAVRMRRFADDARLDHVARAGKLDATMIDRLARSIAAFHGQCAPAGPGSEFGTAATIHDWTRNTMRQLRALIAKDGALSSAKPHLERVLRWSESEFARREGIFTARRAAGFVRECHGDLHLANVALIDGEPVAFDCIEFNADLRFIDVMSDVAFTWMDLIDHDLPQLAARFLNAYLEATGDYTGLATLRFYAVYRALVRALVAVIRGGQTRTAADRSRDAGRALRYLAVAERLTQTPAPQMILVGGVTGSGKTTVAQHLLERLDGVRVRSDIERKRHAGVAPSTHAATQLDAGLYDPATTQATYAQLAAIAPAIIDAGFVAIVDATFQRRVDRDTLRALAALAGARFTLVRCDASVPSLRARVEARMKRGDDASDATAAVLERQLASYEAPAADEAAFVKTIDTDAEPATVALRCASLARELAAAAQSKGGADEAA